PPAPISRAMTAAGRTPSGWPTAPCTRPSNPAAMPGRAHGGNGPAGTWTSRTCAATRPLHRHGGTSRSWAASRSRGRRSGNRPLSPPRQSLGYPAAMPRRTLAPALAALLLLMSGAAHAVQVGEVVIRGLDDEMEENVRVSLSL